MNNSNDFYETANAFCALIESMPIVDKSHYKELLCFLSKLYFEALYLQDVEPLDDMDIRAEHITISFGEVDGYWEVYNTYERDELVCGSLSDDFGDIYKELKTGLMLYEKGHVNNAFWNWKWSFENHWSYHAVDSMRALNQLMND